MSEININDIRSMCRKEAVNWTAHVLKRLLKRNISENDVLSAVMSEESEIIEQYPNAFPYPGCLILGLGLDNRSIHIVCGLCKNAVHFITTYEPDKDRWSDDFKTRKES